MHPLARVELPPTRDVNVTCERAPIAVQTWPLSAILSSSAPPGHCFRWLPLAHPRLSQHASLPFATRRPRASCPCTPVDACAPLLGTSPALRIRSEHLHGLRWIGPLARRLPRHSSSSQQRTHHKRRSSSLHPTTSTHEVGRTKAHVPGSFRASTSLSPPASRSHAPSP